jgi:SAM-dependent methyltransferase
MSKPKIIKPKISKLWRFVLIAAIAPFILIACSLFLDNSFRPDKSLIEIPSLPPAINVDRKTVDPERTPDAPYLQTPQEVVIKMLEMAKVTKEDLVYDLGSGDGRIAIAAAQKFGARAIGIEIDPELIRESDRALDDSLGKAIARNTAIRDRLKFIKQDFFKTDLRDATVITLYLLPEANLRVRSEILPKLKSGTRIVSHEYDFGNLPPNQIEKIKIGDREHRIYLWVL